MPLAQTIKLLFFRRKCGHRVNLTRPCTILPQIPIVHVYNVSLSATPLAELPSENNNLYSRVHYRSITRYIMYMVAGELYTPLILLNQYYAGLEGLTPKIKNLQAICDNIIMLNAHIHVISRAVGVYNMRIIYVYVC